MTTQSGPWLGRFEPPAPVRAQGAFHAAATRERDGGEPRLVVFAAPGRDAGRARQALAELERVHRLLDHPRIAPVAGGGEHGGVPYVALACDARLSLAGALHRAQQVGLRVAHPQADGFILGLREALQAAHRVRDGGRPVCLGALGYASVVFSPSGRHWLVGFGHGVMTHDEHGALLGGEPVFQAPEVVLGDRPSPSGDFVALIMMMRSMLPAMTLAPQVARVVLGRTLAEDVELVRCLLWFERRVVAAPARQRATIEQAIEVSNRIRTLLGVVPDPAGFERLLGEALGPLGDAAPAPGLRIGPDAGWMELPDGSRHPLGTRAALRRVLLALAEARLHRPGASLSLDDLIQAGWPGQRLRDEAGANRTYVLLSELRRLGLRDALQRHDSGYRLDPALPVHIEGRGD